MKYKQREVKFKTNFVTFFKHLTLDNINGFIYSCVKQFNSNRKLIKGNLILDRWSKLGKLQRSDSVRNAFYINFSSVLLTNHLPGFYV